MNGATPSKLADGLVHGMGLEPCEADWPALGRDEVRMVLERFAVAGAEANDVEVIWHSPRPMSAAAIVRCGGAELFVKRHHASLRGVSRLCVEHQLAAHLRETGQPLARVIRGPSGETVVESGEYLYEVHEKTQGLDLYRDVPSWHPFLTSGHAREAGRALARFHLAARGFAVASTPPSALATSDVLVSARDPRGALERLMAAWPGLARVRSPQALVEDFTRYHLGSIEVVAPLLGSLDRQWGHGDWHPSNLAWSSPAPDAAVVGVFDLGLANRTSAVHDLATALERSTIDWLDTARSGAPTASVDDLDALLDGYEEIRPLERREWEALVALLPVVHVEYALSEVEYFSDVVSSPVNAELAYDGYFVGHARWFKEAAGAAMIEHLRRRAH